MAKTMSKAEDRYLEHFQDGRVRNCSSKEAFLLGYHQAEKDLELTWEDVKMLQDISSTVYAEVAQGSVDYYQIYPTEQSFLEEVLKRFKEHNKL